MSDLVGQRLSDAEAVIERGLATFVEVGAALMRIRDERLYRVEYGTFEEYCRERWGFTDRRARQMMDAAEVAESLPTGTMVPTSERQARELSGLDPETAAEVMETAAEAGPVTAAAIRDARAKVTGQPQPTRPADWACHCGAAFKTAHTHCGTCGDHYPEPVHCPTHTVSVDTDTGEILDGPTLAGRAAADAGLAMIALSPEQEDAFKFERNFSRSLTAAAALLQFPSTRCADIADDDLVHVIDSFDRQWSTWITEFRSARKRGLRLVKEQ